MLTPLSALIGRLGAVLPLFVIAAVAAVAVGVAVRFVGLFFAGVDRGETHVAWLPKELAPATSFLVRAGIVLGSMVLAAPLITGTDEGALARAGLVALVALGLACTPVLACLAAGVPAVYGRKLRQGDFVEAGGRAGTVREVTLLEVVLEDALGCEVRVPQLLGLWHPTRVLGSGALATLDLSIDPRERPAKVEEALVGAAVAVCERARGRAARVARRRGRPLARHRRSQARQGACQPRRGGRDGDPGTRDRPREGLAAIPSMNAVLLLMGLLVLSYLGSFLVSGRT